MKYSIIVSTDEEALREATGMEDTSAEGMIENEAGWMAQSGIETHGVLQLPTDDDQPLVDEVIEQIKKDVHDGDFTVIDELLKFIPKKYLIGSLPEERWKEFE